MGSPPALVPSAHQSGGLIVLLIMCTEPSTKRMLTPWGCVLQKSSTWLTELLGVCGGLSESIAGMAENQNRRPSGP